jgi:phosphoglycerol transferase MdoB-like AlkP superfamily enzyme
MPLTCRKSQTSSWRTLLTVALIWALEIFVFQALSFHFDYPVPLAKRIGAHVVRLLLDGLFSLGLVLLLPRVLTLGAFLIFIVGSQGLSYYQAVFGRVLSWQTLSLQFAEGLASLRFEWSYLDWRLLAALLAGLLLKGWLLRRAGAATVSWRWRLTLGVVSLLAYALLLAVAMWRIDRPEKLRTFASADRFGMTYGFLPLWACERFYLDEAQLVREAVAQRELATSRLSAIEAPQALTGDVVLIQVESLDWRILHHRVEGRSVMPFLTRLCDQAMCFKIAAIHENGSGDTDFVMLNAVPPSPTVITYKIRDYPYGETLPQKAARAGYRTVALHGNSGQFFERRRTFTRMGFTCALFLEEIRDELGLPTSLWGIRDDALLQLSQKLLLEKEPEERQLHYLITLTSHQPFNFLEPEMALFLPQRRDVQSRYFNSMHFVDRELEAYINALPENTLVVIFGDHRAMVEYASEVDVGGGRREYVPLLIHRVGVRLAERQASRALPLAQSGELDLIDAATYVHGWFSKNGGEGMSGGRSDP